MSRRAPALVDAQIQPFEVLGAAIRRLPRRVDLHLNGNRRILISLRGGGPRPSVISIHPLLLNYPRAMADLPGWVGRGGGKCTPAIREALDGAGSHLRGSDLQSRPVVHLEPIGGAVQLQETFAAIHAAYFQTLSCPTVAWSRQSLKSRQRHLRFASYRRTPPATVLVHPRLNQPWVAREFINYVLYHELCHHAQACDPRRYEKPHSARFRVWERQYPNFALILLWERQHLERFLQAPEAMTGTECLITGTCR